MKLPDFLEVLNQGTEKAFGENAQAMIDSLLNAKLPPKLKRSFNLARLENATYEEIVTHLERELELNGLEEGDNFPVPTMSPFVRHRPKDNIQLLQNFWTCQG